MIYKELVEFLSWTLRVLIDFPSQVLTEEKSVSETTLDWRKFFEKDEQVSVEDSNFIS